MTETPVLGQGAFADFIRNVREVQRIWNAWEQRAAQLSSRPNTESSTPEVAARVNLIDDTLDALDWDVAPFSEEIVREYRVRGGARPKFADYVGVSGNRGTPTFLVEAKGHWEAAPTDDPMWRAANPERSIGVEQLVEEALAHLANPVGPPPLRPDCMEWLDQVKTYVTRLAVDHGRCVELAVITTGKWWLTIANAHDAFAGTGTGEVAFFPDFDSVASVRFHNLLAKRQLVRQPTGTIEAANLLSYCRVSDIVWLGYGIWVHQGQRGWLPQILPRVEIGPALVIELRSGDVLRVTSTNGDVLQKDLTRFGVHRSKVEEMCAALHEETRQVAAGLPAPMPLGGCASIARTPPTPAELAEAFPKIGPAWIITLGEARHFIAEEQAFEACPYHDHVAANAAGHALVPAIMGPSVKPIANFGSGHTFHCASRTVRDRKGSDCLLAGFESAMCCRACVFERTCWSEDDLAAFPCIQ